MDAVAHLFFKAGSYVQRLEKSLFYPSRAASVMDARNWVEDTVARLARLCHRWNYPLMRSDKRVVEIALEALPLAREQDIRTHLKSPTVEELWELAAEQEGIGKRFPDKAGKGRKLSR